MYEALRRPTDGRMDTGDDLSPTFSNILNVTFVLAPSFTAARLVDVVSKCLMEIHTEEETSFTMGLYADTVSTSSVGRLRQVSSVTGRDRSWTKQVSSISGRARRPSHFSGANHGHLFLLPLSTAPSVSFGDGEVRDGFLWLMCTWPRTSSSITWFRLRWSELLNYPGTKTPGSLQSPLARLGRGEWQCRPCAVAATVHAGRLVPWWCQSASVGVF